MQQRSWQRRGTRRRIPLLITGIILVLVLGLLAYWSSRTPTDTPQDAASLLSTDATRFLDGVTVDPLDANRLPLAVVIDNTPAARPQAGLSAAKLVYESLVEGGVTRLLAVYDGSEALPRIGPVRSARAALLTWRTELGAVLVHAGGSTSALEAIGSTPGSLDLDQLAGDAPYFVRDADLAQPHNLFTSTERLAYAARDYSWPHSGTFTQWPFQTPAPLSARPLDVSSFAIDFSTYAYRNQWTYDRDTNRYARSQGGEASLDATTGEQITAANVIVQFVGIQLATDGVHINLDLLGSGSARVFRDGAALDATWTKPDQQTRTVYTTADGSHVRFNPGPTWIAVVPEGTDITTQP